VARGVELVDRVCEGHAERRVYLGTFSSHQEPVEILEHLDIAAPRRGGQAVGHQLGDYSVHVLRASLPRRHGQEGQEPLQHHAADRAVGPPKRRLQHVDNPLVQTEASGSRLAGVDRAGRPGVA
jgi:hypothetical protein